MSQIICCHIGYLQYPEARYSYLGQMFLDQDYTFFALLGGGPWIGRFTPRFALRGFPTDVNLFTNIAWLLLVSDQQSGLRRTISRNQAEKWVREGVAQWVGKDCITDPDYFNPSWLKAEELEQVHTEYLAHTSKTSATVEALVNAMRSLPGARLVYWFSN